MLLFDYRTSLRWLCLGKSRSASFSVPLFSLSLERVAGDTVLSPYACHVYFLIIENSPVCFIYLT